MILMNTMILSDIHGNIAALEAILEDAEKYVVSDCILLGDLIDYGLHSNEVIERIKEFPYRIECNIWGNHETSIMNNDYNGFSSPRGADCARYTNSIMTPGSKEYIRHDMDPAGVKEFSLHGKRCIAVHGSLGSQRKSIDGNSDLSLYEKYDYVFSGHSHIPHFFEKYYDADDPQRRNRKKTIFINPGSAGQPRNMNNRAQYVILDMESEEMQFRKVQYDISKEQRPFNGQIDEFYMRRLETGI